VVVRLRGVRLATEFRVRMRLVRRRIHGHEVQFFPVRVGRGIVLVRMPVFVCVRVPVLVRVRVFHVAVPVRVFVGVGVIVRMLVRVHVTVLRRVVVRVRHGRFPSRRFSACFGCWIVAG